MPLSFTPQKGFGEGAKPGQWVGTTEGEIIYTAVVRGERFKPRRFLVTTCRNGKSATALCVGQVFIGNDNAGASIEPVDLEALGNPQAFDTGVNLRWVESGVYVTILAKLGGAPMEGTDSIALTITMLGYLDR